MTNNSSLSNKPRVAFTQEIRFAVVMYGGSSLCIYMNGVAQELLRLVRATAPDPVNGTRAYLPDGSEKLGGSGQIYRKLGQMLSRGDTSLQLPDESKDSSQPHQAKPLRTRFVIDVLSGTSAGGINAVYLAKALANDQDLEELKKLWVETADADVLMNDNHSSEKAKIALAAQKEPRSLFNSRLMYYMLLDALGNMDRQKNSSGGDLHRSPYVDELDLYVTATDIVGRKIRLRLADTIARERRHLNMFHFRYSDERFSGGDDENHFKAKFNPFLAFAARCTSAHPVPFEPVKLSDIDEALVKLNLNVRADNEEWQTFYEEYLQPDIDLSDPAQKDENPDATRARLAKEFKSRPFNDGGILDNSPFSFAIDSLQFRHSDLPVDRKLLYIEPVPEHPEAEVDSMSKPDALATGWLSLSVLPRYQFIREDLERLLERNRLIERVKRILTGVERDEMERFWNEYWEGRLAKPLDSSMFGGKTLSQMIGEIGMGAGWGGYQRLRVGETTDEMTAMIGQAAGFNEKSDEFLAIHYLVRTWRQQNYDANKKGYKGTVRNDETRELSPEEVKKREPKDAENLFLYHFDLKWRLRRLKFVMTKIDELSCFDGPARDVLGISENFSIPEQEKNAFRYLVKSSRGPRPATDVIQQFYADLRSYFSGNAEAQESFWWRLRVIKKSLSRELLKLQLERRALLSRGQRNPLAQAVAELGIGKEMLRDILEPDSDAARAKLAEEKLYQNKDKFDDFVKAVAAELKLKMADASLHVRGGLNEQEQKVRGLLEVPADALKRYMSYKLRTKICFMAKSILMYYYENFDRYDVFSYPILYATNVGEEVDTVEVFRISPEDAGHLVTDRKDQKRKLAGTSLGNFGAFFDKEFRRNDILWGRLDAAERIITALLSSVPVTNQKERDRLKADLIMDAQRAILAEEYNAENKAGLRGLLGSALDDTKSAADNIAFRNKLNERLESETPNLSKVRDFLNACLRGTDPLLHFRDTYKFEHDLEPEVMIRLSGRASKVFGKMLEGIADTHRIEKKRIVWVTRLTQLFWGLVEIAVPGSYGNLVYRYWLKLLYGFEVLLIVLGTLLLNPTIQRFGATAFGITAVINILVLILSDRMRSKYTVLNAAGFLFGVAILLFAAIGGAKVAGLFGATIDHTTPLAWVGGNLKLFSGWLANFLPQPVLNFLGRLHPLYFTLGFVLVLSVIVITLNWVKQSWKWLRETVGRRFSGFEPVTIKKVEKERVTKTVRADGKGLDYNFPIRLSEQPKPQWADIFKLEWNNLKWNTANPLPQARIDEREILLTCARDDMQEAVAGLKAALSATNQAYRKELDDARAGEAAREKQALEGQKAIAAREQAEVDEAVKQFGKFL